MPGGQLSTFWQKMESVATSFSVSLQALMTLSKHYFWLQHAQASNLLLRNVVFACEYEAISFHFFTECFEKRMSFLSKKTALKSTFVKESYMQQSAFDDFSIFNDKSPKNDHFCT